MLVAPAMPKPGPTLGETIEKVMGKSAAGTKDKSSKPAAKKKAGRQSNFADSSGGDLGEEKK